MSNVGSYWLKCDLQVHTPYKTKWEDFSFSNPQTEEEKNTWATRLIEEANRKKLSLIALTEHNNGEFIDYAIKASKRSNVVVLPGVEVSSTEGIHLIAIFNPETNLQETGHNNWKTFIEHFLTSIGVPMPRFDGGRPALASQKVIGILESVNTEGGICIFPHALNHNGAMENMRSDTLLGWTSGDSKRGIYKHKLCRIIQIPGTVDSLRAGDKTIVTGHDVNYGSKKVACITTSDTRSFAKLGENNCWIKASPSFEGLKQIMYEPSLRVHVGQTPPQYLHRQITEIKMSNTEQSETYCLPSNTPISLNPNLNVIIGGRGTGKTTVLESLGFIFDQHTGSNNTEVDEKRIQLIPKTIEELESKSVEDGSISLNTKYGQSETNSSRLLVYSSEKPSIGFDVQYWPQGEIEEHAYSTEKLKKLLQPLLYNSEFNNKEEELEKLLVQAKALSTKFATLKELKYRLNTSREKLMLHTRVLSTIQDKSFQQLISEMKQLSEEKRTLEHAISIIDTYKEHLEIFLENTKFVDSEGVDWQSVLKTCNIDEDITTPDKTNKELGDRLNSTSSLREKIITSTHFDTINKKLSEAQAKYAEVAKQLGLNLTQAQIAESSNQVVALQQEITKLEKSIKEIESTTVEHAEIIQQIDEIKTELRNIRKRTFQKISTELGQGVSIEDGEVIDEKTVQEVFISLAEKQNLRIREMVSTILSNVGINDLIKHLVEETIPACVDHQYELTTEWFFSSKEYANRKLLVMRLKEIIPTFAPSVKQDGKNLEELSFGERCALVLRIVLGYGESPVIIDQPEDHLDNEFITKSLLEILKDIKNGRQIILATHNPNIVVNADAENVIIFQKPIAGSHKCQVKNGGLESKEVRQLVANILEGGEEAFKKREIRYEFSVVQN